MKHIVATLTIAGVLLAAGCARFSTTQTDTSYEKGEPNRSITTEAKATTFFAGKSALSNWKASQTDKTQGASVGNLAVESNAGTNLNSLVESAVGAAVKAAIKP